MQTLCRSLQGAGLHRMMSQVCSDYDIRACRHSRHACGYADGLTCSSFHFATCVGASHAFTFASSAGELQDITSVGIAARADAKPPQQCCLYIFSKNAQNMHPKMIFGCCSAS